MLAGCEPRTNCCEQADQLHFELRSKSEKRNLLRVADWFALARNKFVKFFGLNPKTQQFD